MREDAPQTGHALTLEGRARAVVTGVSDVELFNEQLVALSTVAGTLTIMGNELHISPAQPGERFPARGRTDRRARVRRPAEAAWLEQAVQITCCSTPWAKATYSWRRWRRAPAIGLLYDALRGVRWLLEAGPWLNLAADVAFGIGAGAIAIGCVYFAAYGELRAYSLLGMLCGCILYSASVSRLMRAGAQRLSRALRDFRAKKNQSL